MKKPNSKKEEKNQKNKKQPRLQLNIRLTPEQNELIKQRLQQTQKPKTEYIIDCINNTPIYILPNLEQAIKTMKKLGNNTNELLYKLNNIEENDQLTQKELIENKAELKQTLEKIQQGCDEFWQLLKLLKQEKPKQA